MKKQIYGLLAAVVFTGSSLLLFGMLQGTEWFDITDDEMCYYDGVAPGLRIENIPGKNLASPALMNKIQHTNMVQAITRDICCVY